MLLCLVILLGFVSCAHAASVIPANRLYNWQDYSGYPGGCMINATQTIAQSKTVYTTLGTNATAAQINAAIVACPAGQVVQLTNGTYTISAKILFARSDVVLRGKGKWVSDSQGTRIRSAATFPDDMVLHVKNGWPLDDLAYSTGEVNLTNVVKDSMSITTMQAHGWVAGDRILLDQITNLVAQPYVKSVANYVGRSAGTRPYGQFVQVSNVINTTAVNLTAPVGLDFINSRTPKAIKIGNWVTNIGIESLTIDTLGTSGSQGRSTTQFEGLSDYWIYNVELLGNYYRACWSYGSFRGEWINCEVEGNRPILQDYDASYTSDRAYGIYFGVWNTGVRVLNSKFHKLTLGVTFEGPSVGCVVAYCMFTNMWWMDTGAGESKINFGPLMHGPCPTFALLEGNLICGRWRSDALFGNSQFFTIFKNRIRPQDRRVPGVRDIYFQWSVVEVERDNYGYNFLDNVLGSGLETTYIENCTTFNDYGTSTATAERVIWKTGHAYNSTSSANSDTNVLNSMIRWGNWDTLNAAIMNHPPTYAGYTGDTNSPTAVTSYLFSSKPAWFGNRVWPPVDPANGRTLGSETNIPIVAIDMGVDIFAEQGSGPDGSINAVVGPGRAAPRGL